MLSGNLTTIRDLKYPVNLVNQREEADPSFSLASIIMPLANP